MSNPVKGCEIIEGTLAAAFKTNCCTLIIYFWRIICNVLQKILGGGLEPPCPPATGLDVRLEMSSDSKNHFGFLVEEMSGPELTINSLNVWA